MTMNYIPYIELRCYLGNCLSIYCVFDDFKQDYAWVKHGMIFPFMDYVDRCGVVGYYLFVYVV